MITRLVGNYETAKELPLSEAILLYRDVLIEEARISYTDSLKIYASTLPAYAMGGKPPDPPDMPSILVKATHRQQQLRQTGVKEIDLLSDFGFNVF